MKIQEILTEEELEEINWKKALATGALAGATALGAMSPAQARVSIGPDGEFTKSYAQQIASQPDFKPSDITPNKEIPNKDLKNVDKVDRNEEGSIVITHNGEEYKAKILSKDFSMIPRGATKAKVSQAQMGERGIGNYVVYLLPNGTAYILSGK